VSTTSVNIPFTGISQYASDFQAILNKAVEVAQIPVAQLQAQDSTVLQQKSLLGTLNSSVADLATSMQLLGQVASSGALGATSSDASVVSVTNTGSTAATSYTINSITSAATSASERSTGHFADSVSTAVGSGTFTLEVGSKPYTFSLPTNNLTTLRDQINTLGAGVTASILTTSGGNYLSVTANSTGATTLQLYDGATATGTDLLTGTNQGTNAVFQLNGIDISQPGNAVNSVIPGVTFTILGSSGTPVTLSVASDPTQLSSALQDFVTNYNTVATQVAVQEGASGGPLGGDTIINQLQTMLNQIASYHTSTGTVQNLSDLGIEFSQTGQASFNQTTFDGLSSTQLTDGLAFVGSATTGLGRFSASLTEFSDPIDGVIQAEESGLTTTDQHLQDQITTLNTHIATMQANLTAQLETADAQQAELQSQQTELSATLQGLSMVLYGKNTSSLG
jgi:flagellar hook-associated protein 2